MGQFRPLYVYFRLFHMTQFKYKQIKALMGCLGLELRAAGWKAQTNPLNYGYILVTTSLIVEWIWIPCKQVVLSVSLSRYTFLFAFLFRLRETFSTLSSFCSPLLSSSYLNVCLFLLVYICPFVPTSVTRFGGILTLREKFQKTMTIFARICLCILYQLWQKYYAIGQIIIVINGQKLNSTLAIWSHWSQPTCHFIAPI